MDFERSPGTIFGLAVGYKVAVAGIKPPVLLSDEHVEYIWESPEKILALEFGEDGGLHSSVIRAAY